MQVNNKCEVSITNKKIFQEDRITAELNNIKFREKNILNWSKEVIIK